MRRLYKTVNNVREHKSAKVTFYTCFTSKGQSNLRAIVCSFACRTQPSQCKMKDLSCDILESLLLFMVCVVGGGGTYWEICFILTVFTSGCF